METKLLEFLEYAYELKINKLKHEHLSIIKEDSSILNENNSEFVSLSQNHINKMQEDVGIAFVTFKKSFQTILDSTKELLNIVNTNTNKLIFDDLKYTFHDNQTVGSLENLISITNEFSKSFKYTDKKNIKYSYVSKNILSLLNVEVKGSNQVDKKLDKYCFGNKIENYITIDSYNIAIKELENSSKLFDKAIKSFAKNLDIIHTRMSNNLKEMKKNHELYQNNLEYEMNKALYVALIEIYSNSIKLFINRLNECIILISRVHKNSMPTLNESVETLLDEFSDSLSEYGF